MHFWSAVFELLFSTMLFAKSLMFIPQIWRICQRKEVSALSLPTFLSMNCMQSLMIVHALLRDDLILATGIALSLCTSGTVSGLIIYYRWLHGKKNTVE